LRYRACIVFEFKDDVPRAEIMRHVEPERCVRRQSCNKVHLLKAVIDTRLRVPAGKVATEQELERFFT
jgi:hypothetical protein